MEHILLFFTENFGFFRFFPAFFDFFRFFQFVSVVSLLYRNREFHVSIEPKQTEDPPKQFKREYIWVFCQKIRVVSICFGLLRNSSVCFSCFDIGSKHRNKPKFLVFGFTKQTETNAKQILFQFVSVRTEIYFCLFRGHPTRNPIPPPPPLHTVYTGMGGGGGEFNLREGYRGATVHKAGSKITA
jgi:hypothetical protein